jgi:uncharacterized protein (TIGR00255 family)
MMYSMTGFGRAEGVDHGVALRFEISSVNRKQFDVKFSLPKELAIYEGTLRANLAKRLTRGSIMVRAELNYLEDAPAASRIDHAFLNTVIREAREAAEKNGLDPAMSIGQVLAVPGVVVPASSLSASPEFETFLLGVFNAALDRHIEMRRTEGAALERDILARIDEFESLVAKIRALTPGLPEQQAARMRERLKDAGFNAEADDERMLREFVIFADRLDVTEELTRLDTHFKHFRSLAAGGGSPGRSLDFLMQEMFREINTLGNKAGTAEISPLVVAVKTGLEKVREQIQNIE